MISGVWSRRKCIPIPALPSINDGFGPPVATPLGQEPVAPYFSMSARLAVLAASAKSASRSHWLPAQMISDNPPSP